MYLRTEAVLLSLQYTYKQPSRLTFTQLFHAGVGAVISSAPLKSLKSVLWLLLSSAQDGQSVSRKTLTFCAHRLSISNNRLDGAYYTLASLKQNGEPVPVEAVNTVIVGCAIRYLTRSCFVYGLVNVLV